MYVVCVTRPSHTSDLFIILSTDFVLANDHISVDGVCHQVPYVRHVFSYQRTPTIIIVIIYIFTIYIQYIPVPVCVFISMVDGLRRMWLVT